MEDLFEDEDEIFISDANQYFLFVTADQLYALEALSVVEIVEYQNVTKVPRMNLAIKGVINLRGEIIGVLDLKQRILNEKTQIHPRSALVIVQIPHEEQNLKIAILVDSIYEVDALDEDSFKLAPDFGTTIRADFIQHVTHYKEKNVLILDINTLLNVSEISLLEEVS